MLDDKNLDAVSIATPNHWHALMTIWACQAGKDVYVEKPCSHNVHEGRIAVEAARKYNRIVQHGTQSRSQPGLGQHGRSVDPSRASSASCSSPAASATSRAAASASSPTPTPPDGSRFQPLARPGARAAVPRQPGPLQLALVLGFRQRRHRQPGRPPDGHRPLGDPRRRRCPKSVISLGGRFGYTDQGETPNTQIAVFDFGDTQLIFEVRGLKTDDYPRRRRSATSSISRKGRSSAASSTRKGSDKAEPLAELVEIEADAWPGQGPLRQLHRRRPQPQGRGPERRHPRRALLRRPVPPGQHLVPARDARSRSTSRPRPSATTRRPYETLARMEEHLTRRTASPSTA